MASSFGASREFYRQRRGCCIVGARLGGEITSFKPEELVEVVVDLREHVFPTERLTPRAEKPAGARAFKLGIYARYYHQTLLDACYHRGGIFWH